MKSTLWRLTLIVVICLTLITPATSLAAPRPDDAPPPASDVEDSRTDGDEPMAPPDSEFGVTPMGPVSNRASLKTDVCYQIMTDRFYNANTGNDAPYNSPDHSQWKLYWGGDWDGITAQMTYLKNMGVTCIWISPPVDNMNATVSYGDGFGDNAGYHGYWARDFKAPEEHFGTWTDFSELISAAHTNGVKVIIDWAPNHTSPADPANPSFGEQGALYNNGVFMRDYDPDPSPQYFHHNGGISDWNDRYSVQYRNLADLADLEQVTTDVNQYFKGGIKVWIDKGIDGIRVDAVKHMTFGWQRAYADYILKYKDMFLFGEWYLGSSDPLYRDAVRFADDSGISELDFELNRAIRDVFGYGSGMSTLDNAISYTGNDYRYESTLVTFIDNHDMSRFLTINNNNTRLHQALVFLLTVRGTPMIYYGTEQYLHNDTSGGGDPYNRPMMSSWSQTTTAYKVVKALSSLKQSQPALQFGTHQQRWINSDVYIYERKLNTDVVLVAMNKSSGTTYHITGLYTALPAGTYTDKLTGLLGGSSITVNTGSGGNNPVVAFNLGPGVAAVWSYKQTSEPSTPVIGSTMPTLTRATDKITIEGRGFGTFSSTYSKVKLVTAGGVEYNATVTSSNWTATRIVATVPTMPAGVTRVKVTNNLNKSSALYSDIMVLSGQQVPVTFVVNNAYTSWGDQVYLTGSVFELSNWSTATVPGTNLPITTGPLGPMLTPSYPTWFITASVPCNTAIQFKFLKILSGGTVKWESGSNHTYTTPACGSAPVPGTVTVTLNGWNP